MNLKIAGKWMFIHPEMEPYAPSWDKRHKGIAEPLPLGSREIQIPKVLAPVGFSAKEMCC